MIEERRKWTEDISKRIGKIRGRDLKGVVEEMWTRMRYRRGGEMAMMGCFQPRWVNTIYKGRMTLSGGEERVVGRILREIGMGARGLMKFYNGVEKGVRSGRELRQTTMLAFWERWEGERYAKEGRHKGGKGKDEDKGNQ